MGIITKCAVCNRVIEKDKPSDLDICEECEMQEWDIEIDDEYCYEMFRLKSLSLSTCLSLEDTE